MACSPGVLTGNACYCLSLGNCDELGKKKGWRVSLQFIGEGQRGKGDHSLLTIVLRVGLGRIGSRE